MRAIRWLGPILLVAGIAALVVGFMENQVALNLFVIFPVITATGLWSGLGILLLIVGFLALFFTWPAWVEEQVTPRATQAPPYPVPPTSEPAGPGTSSRRWGGVVFLGPIPVVFGSDAKMAKWMIVAGFVLLAALVVLTVIAIWGI